MWGGRRCGPLWPAELPSHFDFSCQIFWSAHRHTIIGPELALFRTQRYSQFKPIKLRKRHKIVYNGGNNKQPEKYEKPPLPQLFITELWLT